MTTITDGDFYLINTHDAIKIKPLQVFWTRELESVILHDCKAYPGRDAIRTRYLYSPPDHLQYLTLPINMHDICPWCKQVPSEKLVTLWTLQNFDHLEARRGFIR